MKRLWGGFALCAMVVLCGSARAQVAAYGMASGGYLSAENFSAYGGTFGVYDNFKHVGPVRIGGDARLFVQSSGNNNGPYGNQMRGGLAGARVAFFSHAVPFSPYIQAEIGGVGTNYGTLPERLTSFAFQVQLGLDYTIVPHLDARFEYGAGEIGTPLTGNQQGMQQAGLGLVVRFY